MSIENLEYKDSYVTLNEEINKRVLVLDGALGTRVQSLALSEADFRGERFAAWPHELKGLNDLLCLTKPAAVEEIHRQYMEAGADIITTNSFNSNAISLADYGLSELDGELATAAAALARRVADSYMEAHAGHRIWVAGSIGPTAKSLVMELSSADVNKVTWAEMEAAFRRQALGLIRGGADILLIETIFDTLNAKCAVFAARRAMEEAGVRVPLMLSVTLTESGRTLSGQTLGAFVASVMHAEPLAIGLNCGFGAEAMSAYVEELQGCECAVSLYPNAGLPNALGGYDETPAMMVAALEPMLQRGFLNIVGGCCGTTPEHIRLIAKAAAESPARVIPNGGDERMVLSGLEAMEVIRERNFVNVGERCNVAGSRKFLRLIKEGNIAEAVEIAVKQVEAGAQMVDVNMDDGMLDAPAEMRRFLGAIATEPAVARVPVMIDSSSFDTIMEALQSVQGRSVVNSISLKEGEELFLERARLIREMGAAVIVMAFDECGQADSFARRIEVAERSWRLLTEKAGYRGCDIVIDPNILAVATGIAEHDRYALDFIEATEWIKKHLPGAKVSGGVSNLSFSFRGNNYLREAMHALFLHHAIGRGLDMAIVNAASLMPVDEIGAPLREAIDDVLLCRRPDATERLVAMAPGLKDEAAQTTHKVEAVKATSPAERLTQRVVSGHSDCMEPDLAAAHAEFGSAVAVIDGPLMAGMDRVGQMFGSGKMFLPQVVKSAHVMKQAVAWLTPFIEEERRLADAGSTTRRHRRIVIATVKGDVHDIGKNIVSVILNCNGLDIIDLGVMVPGEDIVAAAQVHKADYIGLSGLITPSLDEMVRVATLMEDAELKIPLLVGGATTSDVHTAVKIAPCYSGPVFHTHDAAQLPPLLNRLADTEQAASVIEANSRRQAELRSEYAAEHSGNSALTVENARRNKVVCGHPAPTPSEPGVHDIEIPIEELIPLVNWKAFLLAWGIEPRLAEVSNIDGCDHCRAQWLAQVGSDYVGKAAEAMQLLKEAKRELAEIAMTGLADGPRACVAILEAQSDGYETITIKATDGSTVEIETPRRLKPLADGTCPALADYVSAFEKDYVGLFAVTAGRSMEIAAKRCRENGDDYRSLMLETLAHRLAEAATEWTHREVAKNYWGYEQAIGSIGLRPAVGYPSLPNQLLVKELDKALHYSALGIDVTENGALWPTASTTGLILANSEARYFSVK